MSSLLLFLTVITCGIQGIFAKKYSLVKNGGMFFYCAAATFFALIVFIFQSGFKLNPDPIILLYSFFFALAYCSAVVFQFIALKHGPLSVTTLVVSYSLIIPTFYGIIFLNEGFTVIKALGLLFLVVSLALAVELKKDDKKINLLWIIAVVIAFIGNGMCSTVQKMFQIRLDGRHGDEFMVFALIMVIVFMLSAGFITERSSFAVSIKKGWYLAAPQGIANGLTNMFVILLNGMIPASVLFPVVSAGGVISSAVFGIVFFKEKLGRLQIIGVIVGIAAIVLLNI